MSIKATDLVEFASEVIKPGASEAALRAGASRAYYASFYALASFAHRLPRSTKCADGDERLGHTELVERLREWKTESVHPGPPGMSATKGQLHHAVDGERRTRIVADYRLSNEFSLAEAQTQLSRVKKILRYSDQIDEVCNAEPQPVAVDK